MIRRTLMSPTQLDNLLMNSTVRYVYMHIAEIEDTWSSNQHNHQYNEGKETRRDHLPEHIRDYIIDNATEITVAGIAARALD